MINIGFYYWYEDKTILSFINFIKDFFTFSILLKCLFRKYSYFAPNSISFLYAKNLCFVFLPITITAARNYVLVQILYILLFASGAILLCYFGIFKKKMKYKIKWIIHKFSKIGRPSY